MADDPPKPGDPDYWPERTSQTGLQSFADRHAPMWWVGLATGLVILAGGVIGWCTEPK